MTSGLRLHATTVSIDGSGILILGASGRGKSSLALQLIALGATLVADDQTEVFRQDNHLIAQCPPGLQGLIEARGIGLLRAPTVPSVPLSLCVDLDRKEADRLPPPRSHLLLGVTLPLVLAGNSPHFPAALQHYVRYGRQA